MYVLALKVFPFSCVVLNVSNNKEKNHSAVLIIYYGLARLCLYMQSAAVSVPAEECWEKRCQAGAGAAVRVRPLCRFITMPASLPRIMTLIKMQGMCSPTWLFLSFLDKREFNKEANKSVQVPSPCGKAGVLGRLG